MKITARINTLNEEDTIAGALESVAWADEILVVDSGSSDRTRAVARRYTDRVVMHPFANFGAQHTFADSLCSHPWVLPAMGVIEGCSTAWPGTTSARLPRPV